MSLNSEWAEWYARQGWPVFPLQVGAKAPLRKTNGLKDATTDLDLVDLWWSECPDYNIGCATGRVFDVLDLDGPEALGLALDLGLPEEGASVRTGNGLHVYLAPVEGSTNKASLVEKGSGIDYRAKGGYVVLPPSLHPSGELYGWTGDSPADVRSLPRCPSWLAELVVPPPPTPRPEGRDPQAHDGDGTPYAKRALTAECDEVRRAGEGQRNHTLNRASYNLGQLVGGGELIESAAWRELLDAGLGAGLKQFEAERTIRSGLEAGSRNPRTAPK